MFNAPVIPNPEREAFNAAVWNIVRQIPAGRVATYGQIAAFIPCPRGVTLEDYKAFRSRWVGYAMAESPTGVPWQRVINAQGKISVRKGAANQRQMLEAEGVLFDQKERVNLRQYGWSGPSPEWLRENGLLEPSDA